MCVVPSLLSRRPIVPRSAAQRTQRREELDAAAAIVTGSTKERELVRVSALAVAAIGILRREFGRDSGQRKDNRMSSGADECRLKGGHPPAG